VKLLRLGIYLFFMISLLAGVWLSAAEAAEVTWNPSVDLRLKYDDNINFSSRYAEHDWIYEIRPELKWRRRTDQNDFSLSAQLLGQKFDTHSDLDTLDQYYRLEASSQVRPTLGLSFDGSYRKDTTLDSELSEEGILLFREDRKVYRMNPSMRWQATERSAWEMSIPFLQENYGGQYDDYDYKSTGTYFEYSRMLADNRTYIFVQPAFSYDDFKTGDTRTYEMMCGVDRAFSERLTLRAGGGVYLSRIREDTKTSNETGFAASVEAQGKLERGNWRARYIRDVYPSGIGRTVLRNRLTLKGMYRLSERMCFTGEASYTDVSSQGDGGDGDYGRYEYSADYWTVDICPGLAYRLTEHANIGIYYQHRFLDDQEVDLNTTRNLVWISLNFYS
jgi:hypothetical protein